MITGYNTEIKHRGKLFHVQTEDKGKRNPIIESLVYIGGEIFDSVRSNYKKELEAGIDRDQILKLMETQHREVLGAIKGGKYDPKEKDGSKPVGEDLITQEHTLDEVILSLIADRESNLGSEVADAERLCLELLCGISPRSGNSCSVEVCARTDTSGDPVEAARITVKLVSRSERPQVLSQGETDSDGLFAAEVSIPDRPFDHGKIVIQASSEHGFDEIRRPLKEAGS